MIEVHQIILEEGFANASTAAVTVGSSSNDYSPDVNDWTVGGLESGDYDI
ncbi:hypothetical protein ACFSQ3_09355 [Sphingobacterium corticis]|uniref:Uncharacterized protein n=1 Tax=Sphingobacterium corticis TaxID=1812823 RepID=A0ABW5NL92_9SPHI